MEVVGWPSAAPTVSPAGMMEKITPRPVSGWLAILTCRALTAEAAIEESAAHLLAVYPAGLTFSAGAVTVPSLSHEAPASRLTSTAPPGALITRTRKSSGPRGPFSSAISADGPRLRFSAHAVQYEDGRYQRGAAPHAPNFSPRPIMLVSTCMISIPRRWPMMPLPHGRSP